jgi:hypothetical protein
MRAAHEQVYTCEGVGVNDLGKERVRYGHHWVGLVTHRLFHELNIRKEVIHVAKDRWVNAEEERPVIEAIYI